MRSKNLMWRVVLFLSLTLRLRSRLKNGRWRLTILRKTDHHSHNHYTHMMLFMLLAMKVGSIGSIGIQNASFMAPPNYPYQKLTAARKKGFSKGVISYQCPLRPAIKPLFLVGLVLMGFLFRRAMNTIVTVKNLQGRFPPQMPNKNMMPRENKQRTCRCCDVAMSCIYEVYWIYDSYVVNCCNLITH